MQDGIQVEAHMTGFSPGKHGFHVHQWGDCSAEDGTSTAGHFNPDNREHGGPNDAIRHVGDLGNIEADEMGNATLIMTDTVISFEGTHSIIGRGIIVHAGEDDLK
ncbi:MAG: superoxide dismutase family protein [Bacteroidales bacterium]|nr:superoxide dismutase family protein [Bacteroidales bacterium]